MPFSARELIDEISHGHVRRIDKPWGGEVIIECPTFLLKLITVEDGKRTSLQHHTFKTEVMVVAHGDGGVEMHIDDDTILYDSTDDPVIMYPGVIHRTVGPCQLIEITTLENEDVIRHDDDYGRV